jgi:hypothetical protein
VSGRALKGDLLDCLTLAHELRNEIHTPRIEANEQERRKKVIPVSKERKKSSP